MHPSEAKGQNPGRGWGGVAPVFFWKGRKQRPVIS
jgi:hypothetical protein